MIQGAPRKKKQRWYGRDSLQAIAAFHVSKYAAKLPCGGFSLLTSRKRFRRAYDLALGLKTMAASAPKNTAAAMPAAVLVSPPVNAPIKPIS